LTLFGLGCQRSTYPLHADLDTSDPNLLRVNVTAPDEGTVTLMGTSVEARRGKTSLVINTSQIAPGSQFLRVSFTRSYDDRRGSTVVELNRPVAEPKLRVGSHEPRRERLKCDGEVCDGDLEAPSNGMLNLPVGAPPGCVVEVLGKTMTIPVRFARFTAESEYGLSSSSSTSSSAAAAQTFWIEVKGLETKKAPPLPMKARVTCDDQSADFDFTLTRQ
jgi:hypothetical protein